MKREGRSKPLFMMIRLVPMKIFHDKMEYEICNAKIKLLPEKYRGTTADHPYQLSFGAKTIIRPIEGCKPPIGPKYISLAAIPKNITTDDRYDVLVILIYVEPQRQVPRSTGDTLVVRELVVDPSTDQPLIITAWAEIASREGEQLQEIVGNFPIIGFTCLKPSYHKGFSVATTSVTFVKFNPEGEKADMLRAWANKNRIIISAKQQQVIEARELGGPRVLTMIKALLAKKATVTLQDE
ncbi:replication protein A 70 kDa DNA-binding subunit B-like [Silene latifolia]|uniref:replication protein A 70 kDa DNA-binding subunit B-like n=1 Tax=Silene latifolia TaxID=37657 RepID=UPI003D7834BF